MTQEPKKLICIKCKKEIVRDEFCIESHYTVDLEQEHYAHCFCPGGKK